MSVFGKRTTIPTPSSRPRRNDSGHPEVSATAPGVAAPSGKEHRSKRRKRLLKAGVISYNDHHFTIRCTVRDKSDLGARLKISDRSITPDTFTLFIELDATEVDCEVIWRSNDEVGVKYTSEVRSTPKLRVQVVSDTGGDLNRSIRRKPTS